MYYVPSTIAKQTNFKIKPENKEIESKFIFYFNVLSRK